MRKLVVAVGLMILLLSVSGQTPNEAIILGDWYLLNPNLIESNDTLVFNRELVGEVFTIWSFKADNTLLISSGTIRKNNSKAKCFSGVTHHKWEIRSAKEFNHVLEIHFGNQKTLYQLLELSLNRLEVVKIN